MSKYLTIGQLAKESALSRSTLLYYHRLGLLKAANRSAGNYRLYSQEEKNRLKQICLYRKMGLPLKEIRKLLDQADNTRPETILQQRLEILEKEIDNLHQQQKDILRLLEQLKSRKSARRRGSKKAAKGRPPSAVKVLSLKNKEIDMVNKERWTQIMEAAGFSEQDMHNWHKKFETMEPQAHQEFLESLGIDQNEIKQIRKWSAK
ncbi:MAG: MerR family transcriptional regulator [Sedimentisphaerales bacterium]|nr:MerR family transcriptional regulator [Sedimentisphaerales bacterium]